jgi:hypothetical protein
MRPRTRKNLNIIWNLLPPHLKPVFQSPLPPMYFPPEALTPFPIPPARKVKQIKQRKVKSAVLTDRPVQD